MVYQSYKQVVKKKPAARVGLPATPVTGSYAATHRKRSMDQSAKKRTSPRSGAGGDSSFPQLSPRSPRPDEVMGKKPVAASKASSSDALPSVMRVPTSAAAGVIDEKTLSASFGRRVSQQEAFWFKQGVAAGAAAAAGAIVVPNMSPPRQEMKEADSDKDDSDMTDSDDDEFDEGPPPGPRADSNRATARGTRRMSHHLPAEALAALQGPATQRERNEYFAKKSPREQLAFSHKPRNVDYKPATMKDYRESQQKAKMYKAGGLPLNKEHPDFVASKERAQRQSEYAQRVRRQSKIKHRRQQTAASRRAADDADSDPRRRAVKKPVRASFLDSRTRAHAPPSASQTPLDTCEETDDGDESGAGGLLFVHEGFVVREDGEEMDADDLGVDDLAGGPDKAMFVEGDVARKLTPPLDTAAAAAAAAAHQQQSGEESDEDLSGLKTPSSADIEAMDMMEEEEEEKETEDGPKDVPPPELDATPPRPISPTVLNPKPPAKGRQAHKPRAAPKKAGPRKGKKRPSKPVKPVATAAPAAAPATPAESKEEDGMQPTPPKTPESQREEEEQEEQQEQPQEQPSSPVLVQGVEHTQLKALETEDVADEDPLLEEEEEDDAGMVVEDPSRWPKAQKTVIHTNRMSAPTHAAEDMEELEEEHGVDMSQVDDVEDRPNPPPSPEPMAAEEEDGLVAAEHQDDGAVTDPKWPKAQKRVINSNRPSKNNNNKPTNKNKNKNKPNPKPKNKNKNKKNNNSAPRAVAASPEPEMLEEDSGLMTTETLASTTDQVRAPSPPPQPLEEEEEGITMVEMEEPEVKEQEEEEEKKEVDSTLMELEDQTLENRTLERKTSDKSDMSMKDSEDEVRQAEVVMQSMTTAETTTTTTTTTTKKHVARQPRQPAVGPRKNGRGRPNPRRTVPARA